MPEQVLRRVLLFLLAAGMLLGPIGCSHKMYGAVKFETKPPGAEVVNLRDDASLGVTPVVVTWESDDGKPEYVTIQMRKAGYKEEITKLWVNTRHDSRAAAQAEAQPIFVEMLKRNGQ